MQEHLSSLRARIRICKEYDVTLTDDIKKHALEVAGQVRDQRDALNEYYALIGIMMKDLGVPDTWQYLMNESDVFTASYEGMLEIMLVEMVLADYYTDSKVTHPITKPSRHFKTKSSLVGVVPSSGAVTDEYIEYRKAYKKWQEDRGKNEELVLVSGNEAGVDIQGMDEEELQGTIVDLYKDRVDINDAQSITQMEFYQLVLQDIEEKYEQVNDPEGDKEIPPFEEYLKSLFQRISPDYGQDIFAQMKESGYEQFFSLSGLPRQKDSEVALPWKETDLLGELAKCRYTWQVEELMVKYKLMTTEYLDNSHYQEEWNKYMGIDVTGDEEQDQTVDADAIYEENLGVVEDPDDPEKKKKEFESLDCYAIIEKLHNKATTDGIGKTWEEAMEDILRKAGNSPIAE